MSDRLTDAELASLRQHLREERERNHRVPTLTWAEVDSLLDEVREAREDTRQAAGECRVPLPMPGTDMAKVLSANVLMRKRIAELEAERDEYRAMRDNAAANSAALDSQRRERIAELEAQLDRTERGVVRNAGRLSRERKYRWAHVADAVGCGKTTAKNLCAKHELDPDELVGIPTTPPEAEEDDQ